MNKTMSDSSSSSPVFSSMALASLSPPSPLISHLPPFFTPIQEEENETEDSDGKTGKETSRRRGSGNDAASHNKCRPGNRDKTSVVPVDNNGIFKSFFTSLTKRSPRPQPPPSTEEQPEQLKLVAAELSRKLTQATRNRDDAVLEASRLKYSVSNLEKKLKFLETYQPFMVGNADNVIKHFLVSISESRSYVRILSSSMTVEIRQLGTNSIDLISSILHPHDSKNPKALQFYLEALLNKTFFEDFETVGFHKNSATQILNPVERMESNFKSFTNLQSLTWDEVLSRGTRHFSDEFSRFCDRKMNEVVTMLGWNRTWPESLLEAFFGASKWVWIVHLLANAVHPSLPIFRVEKGVPFESIYMEDMGGRKLVPAVVRVMSAPGFYVYGNVVKCKVICRYYTSNS